MLWPIAQQSSGPDPAVRPGLNFATQDYLALASHPDLRRAALAVADAQRLPSARPGRPEAVLSLERRIAAFLGLPHALTFPTGTDAIRQTLTAFLRPEDHVILDAGAHPALGRSVLACQAQIHRSPAASVEGVERRLSRLARQPRRGRVFIITPSVAGHTSRLADLPGLCALARAHSAVLIVDVTHDLGAMGPCGGGLAEIQGCAGRIDVLLGSFSMTFGATGGFVALRDPQLFARLRENPSPALPTVNAAVILAALDLIASPEGKRRRRKLHGLGLRLRNHLMADGVKVMGKASPFVPILLPADSALPRTALLESAGPRIALQQAPTVPLHAPRWSIRLSAAHGLADIDDLAELIRDVSRAFDRKPASMRVPA